MKDFPELYDFLEEQIDEAFDDVYSEFELYGGSDGKAEEIEYLPRDGFIPHTQGGFEAKGFTSIGYLQGTGKSPSNKEVSQKIDKQYNESMDEALDNFWEKNQEKLKEAGFTKEKTNYNSLNEADMSDLAEELSEYEDANVRDENSELMWQMGVYYYEPKDEDDDHDIFVFSEINFEAPYFRSKYANVVYKKDLSFKDFDDKAKSEIKAAIEAAAEAIK